MAAFTYLWTRKEYNLHRSAGSRRFLTAGGNKFRIRGVTLGGRLYIVACFGDTLYLLGRLSVATVCSPEDVPRLTGDYDFDCSWAADWAVADRERSSAKFFDLVVPRDVVRSIRFAGERPPKFRGNGEDAPPDPQTFRGVRPITEATARRFDALLDQHQAGQEIAGR